VNTPLTTLQNSAPHHTAICIVSLPTLSFIKCNQLFSDSYYIHSPKFMNINCNFVTYTLHTNRKTNISQNITHTTNQYARTHTHTHACTHTHTYTHNHFTALCTVQDNLGEPVPEKTFIHSYLSWSSLLTSSGCNNDTET